MTSKLFKAAIEPQSVLIDPRNCNYTVPRTYGVYRITASKRNSTSRIYRYGNHPIRLKELKREYGSIKLIALYRDRDLAIQRARYEEDKLGS